MAKVYPDREHREEIYEDIDQVTGGSAERTICDWIEKAIKDDDYIAKLHPQISTRNPDLLVLIPNRGLLVIEIKQYSADFLEGYDDNSLLQAKEQFRKGEYENGVKHPYKQAIEYALTISNNLPKFFKKNGFNVPVCKIGCMIAMPNLSDDEYEDLLLMYGLQTELTITKDWLTNEETFYERFTNAVNIIFKNIKSEMEFNDDYYNVLRTYLVPSEMVKLKQNIIPESEKIYSELSNENTEKIENELVDIEQILYGKYGNNVIQEKFDYSLTKIIFNACDTEAIMDECMQLRSRGTKIYLLCIDFDDQRKQRMIDHFRTIPKEYVRDCNDNSYTSVLFNMYFVFLDRSKFEINTSQELADRNEYANIIDGELIERIYSKKPQGLLINEYVPISNNGLDAYLWRMLIECDYKTLFNFDQYIVEHFPIKSDMCVIASAGTGKTYTMVDRIAFLVHKEIIIGDNNRSIGDLIAMMTFTNNSTDEMKERLRNHYANYFAITKKNIFMNIIEQIGGMKIKTIDAMSRFVITKFAHYIGLSSNFTVKSGKYDVGNILRKNLDKHINDEILKTFGEKQIYQIQEYITEFMDFILNRKIRFDNSIDCKNVLANNIVNKNVVKNFIETVIKETNKMYFNYNRENDYLAMNEIGVQVDRIRKQLGELTYEKNGYEKYLFVDEFQDTDNKQIELLHFFATYWNMALFIVGDVKQCIYGFRGANDTAFDTIKNISDYKKRTWNELHLRKNYRTDEALVNKLNSVFSKMPLDLFQYNNSDNLIPQKELNKPNPNCFSMEKYSDDMLINILRNRKNELQGKGGEIAILVRKNSEIDKIRRINELVDDFEIEFDNAGNFFKMDAIIDFYQLVDFLSDISDIKRMYNISISPYCINPLSRSELFNKRNNITIEEFDKFIGFNDKKGFSYYRGIIKEYEEYPCLKNSPALKILRMIINEIKPWERYIPEVLKNRNLTIKENMDLLNKARIDYKKHLFQMFQILIENNKSDYVTLNKIKRYLSINIMSKQKLDILTGNDKSNDSQVKITCTTVHKSKGLQYDTVIIPFTTTDITNDNGIASFIEHKSASGNSIIEYKLRKSRFKDEAFYESASYESLYEAYGNKDQQAEELRILYVALTRAKKKIVCLYDCNKLSKNLGKTKRYWSEYLK